MKNICLAGFGITVVFSGLVAAASPADLATRTQSRSVADVDNKPSTDIVLFGEDLSDDFRTAAARVEQIFSHLLPSASPAQAQGPIHIPTVPVPQVAPPVHIPPAPVNNSPPSIPTVFLNQGWTDDTRASVYHLDQGSALAPLSWILNVEESSSQNGFLKGSEKYGLLFVTDKSGKPEQLPVGFSIGEKDQTPWVGVNCMACHTGSMNINGKKVLIEGGRGLFDFQSFEYGLADAISVTAKDQEKLQRFVTATGYTGSAETLAQELSKYASDLTAMMARNFRYYDANKNFIPYGPGRVDGIEGPTNNTICMTAQDKGSEKWRDILINPKNCSNSSAPTVYPILWGMTQQEYVQWTGFIHSSLGRNVAQGNAFADIWFEEGADGKPVYKTAVNLPAEVQFESNYRHLKSPQWADMAEKGLVPAVDIESASVQHGKTLFQNNCTKCHPEQPQFTDYNAHGYSFWKIQTFPPSVVGTDAKAFYGLFGRTSTLPDYLVDDYKTMFGPNSVGPNNTVKAVLHRSVMISKLVAQLMVDNHLTPMQQLLAVNCRDNHTNPQPGYKARSLEGILFAAPYLHNGSVPTIDDLLKPQAQRPSQFKVGCLNYDTEKMGYDCETDDSSSIYNTELSGNSNSGHEYSNEFSADDRRDVINYMKTLKDPQRPPQLPNAACGEL